MLFSKQREARRQREENEKRQKEIRARMSIDKNLHSMQSQSAKLGEMKKDYINKARNATLTGNAQTLQLARSGLKLCLSKQKFLDSMITNMQIALQTADMNKIVGEFIKSVALVSDEIGSLDAEMDMSKASEAYEQALSKHESQMAALDTFLSTASESVNSISDINSNVTDKEIDDLIDVKAADAESSVDSEIDEKIAAMDKKIGSKE
jgi:hypothetical protein